MKPLFLTLQGINSYENKQEVDFTKMFEFGIFGIFGPTGSGKSTILDAITLALYGKIARFSSTQKQFINTNSEKAEVYLKFETITGIYCVQRTYYKKKSPNLVRFYRVNSNGSEEIIADKNSREVNQAVESEVGLEYDDFIRSVVLPQGRFSDFLLLSSSERRNMLERIFNLEQFGEKLYGQIRQRTKESKNTILRLTETISMYKDTDKNTTNLMENKKTENELLLQDLGKEKKNLEILVEKYKEFLTYYNSYIETSEKLKDISKLDNEVLTKKESLAFARKASLLRNIIDETKNTSHRLKLMQAESDSLAKEALSTTESFKKKKAKYEKTLQEKEQKTTALVGAENNILYAMQLEKELESINEELKKLQDEYKIKNAECKSTKKKILEIEKSIKEIEDNLTKWEQEKKEILHTASERKIAVSGLEWENNIKRLNDNKTKLDKQLKPILKTIEKLNLLEKEKNELIKEKNTALESKTAEISKILEQIKTIESKATTQAVYFLASQLVEGEPCPVCGSKEHFDLKFSHVGNNSDFDDLQKKLANANKKRSFIESEINELKGEIYNISLEIEKAKISKEKEILASNSIANDIDEIEDELKVYKTKIDTAKKELTYKFKTFSEFSEMINENDLLREKIEQNEINARESLKAYIAQLDSTKNEFNVIETHMNQMSATGKEKSKSLDEKKKKIDSLLEGKTITEYSEKIKKEKEAIIKKEASEKKELENADALLRHISEKQAGVNNTLLHLKEVFHVQEQNMQEQIKSHGFKDEKSATDAYLSDDKIISLEKYISEHEKEKSRLTNNLQSLLDNLSGENLTEIPEKCEKYISHLKDLNEKIVSIGEQNAALTEKIKQAKRNLKIVSDLSEEKKQEEKRNGYLNELLSLCKNNAFLAFVAKRQLRYVVTEATRRLKKMTNGRYAIELDNAEFIIRDDFSSGMYRPPASLSGGEIFIVSLCLALALSSKIQMNSNAHLKFFFLDEGFGSLDSALLDTIMDSLETLKNEQMSVGLITHVEELKTRISRKIIIEPSKEGIGGTKIILD